MDVVFYDRDVEELRPVCDAWMFDANPQKFNLRPDVEIGLDNLRSLQASRDSALFVLEDDGVPVGFMGVVKYRSPVGPEMVADEHYWYVMPGFRGTDSMKLFYAVEQWAIANDCVLLLMSASNLASNMHDKVCSIYESLGMKKFETTYAKPLTGGNRRT